jgi:hypothetical protein
LLVGPNFSFRIVLWRIAILVKGELPVDRCRRNLILAAGLVLLHVLGRDLAKVLVAEGGEEVAVDDAPVSDILVFPRFCRQSATTI